MDRIRLALVLVFLSAGPVSAQSLTVPSLAFAGAIAADWRTTYGFLSHHTGTESSPLLQWTHNRPVLTVAAGMAMDAGQFALWRSLIGKRHPKLLAVALYGIAGMRVGVAVYNVRGHPTR